MKTAFLAAAAVLATPVAATAQVAEPIIDGTDAAVGEFPSIVALVDTADPDNFSAQFCAGTLIHPRWVLTAAHCFTDDEVIRPAFATDPRDVAALVGTRDLSSGGRRVGVLRVIIHPDFDPVDFDNDIALLLLAEDVTDITPAPIVRSDTLDLQAPGTLATAAGWGNTDPTVGAFTRPNILQRVDLPIIGLEVANALGVYDGILTANMLPAGNVNEPADTCQGDSGGPLYVRDDDGGLVVSGITSFGSSEDENLNCGNTYGIYTLVSNYAGWIDSHITPRRHRFIQENALLPLADVDTDLDGFSDFEEFAFATSPTSGSDLPPIVMAPDEFRFTTPSIPPQVTFSAEFTPDLVAGWEAVDPTSISTTGGGPFATSAVATSGTSGFYRVRTTAAPGYEPALPTLLQVPGAVIDTLRTNPSDLRSSTYLLGIPPTLAGDTISVSARSSEFPPFVVVVDATTNTPVPGGSGEGSVSFVPAAGAEYTATISTMTAAPAEGSFTVSAFVSQPGLTPIAPNQSRSGTLTSGDAPLPLPVSSGTYRSDTFDATPLTSGTSYIATVSQQTGNELLIDVLDRESNRFLAGGVGSTTFVATGPTALRVSPDLSLAPPSGTVSYTLSLSTVPELFRGVPTGGTLSTSDPSLFFDSGGGPLEFYFDPFILRDLSPDAPIDISVSSPSVDTDVTVIAPDGSNVGFDDDDGPGTSSFLTLLPGLSGNYTIQVSSAIPEETGPYTVRFDLARTIRPGGTSIGSITPGGNDISFLDANGDPATILYENTAFLGFIPGRPYTIAASSGTFDTFLIVYDSFDNIIAQNDDIDFGAGITNSRLTFTPEDGERYLIEVSEVDGATGSYRLQVSP